MTRNVGVGIGGWRVGAGSMLVLAMVAAACSDGTGGGSGDGSGGGATGDGGSSSSGTTVGTTSATTSSGTTSSGTTSSGTTSSTTSGGEGGADGGCLSNDDCIASQYCLHGWGYPECSPASVPDSSWCVDRAESCEPDGGRPVCGCDGVVYPSGCHASMAGVALDSANGCAAPAGTFACRQTFCDAGEVCVVKRDGDDVTPRCEPLPGACGAAASCGCITGVVDGTDCTCEGEACDCETALGAFCSGGLVDACEGDGSAGLTLDCNPEP